MMILKIAKRNAIIIPNFLQQAAICHQKNSLLLNCMIPKIRRSLLIKIFREELYENVQKDIVAAILGETTAFRLSETPVFISKELKTKVFDACLMLILEHSKI